MPHPKGKIKASGDVHLPEIESEDLTRQESHAEGSGTTGSKDDESPRGGNQGGEIKDRETPGKG